MTDAAARAAALGLLLAGLHGAALAQVTETLERKRYDVRPAPGASLLQALNQATPIWRGGQPYHGFTEWRVDWHYRYAPRQDGLCGVTSAEVRLQVTITLPALKNAPAELAAQFTRYASALETHEDGHRQVGRGAAERVQATLLALPPSATCPLLETEIRRAANEVIERARQQDVDYDRETRHGCTQGACLVR